jgi:23S rRNA (cytosine1962-C5)-methyltransferase
MGRVVLTGKGRRWLEGGHPWAFRDDVANAEAEPGEVARIEGPGGKALGFGAYSSASRIAVRRVAPPGREPDRAFWKDRLARSIRARERMGYLAEDGACRLVGGDAEGFPGLVVDRYGSVCVLQSGTQAADRLRDLVVELLEELLPFRIACALDRSDSAVRRLESLERKVEVLRGEVPGRIVVRETGLEYEVDVMGGHKTGHYLDQRENRIRAAARAKGSRTLDAFSYDGLFGIRAALAGADSVLCVDQSEAALERARANAERNGVGDRVQVRRANCMSELRALSKTAARGYVEVNRRALALVEEGGTLVSASCSYNVRPATFVEYLAQAAQASQREVFLSELTGAAPDHPALLVLPESAYLKCAFLRVEGNPRMPQRGDVDDDRDRAERPEAGGA